MANFTSIQRAAAFAPISAFPLDARSYFESYDDALKAANSARALGSTSTVYYYGQIISVAEKNGDDVIDIKLYLMVPEGKGDNGTTLREIGICTGNHPSEPIPDPVWNVYPLIGEASPVGVWNTWPLESGKEAEASTITWTTFN